MSIERELQRQTQMMAEKRAGAGAAAGLIWGIGILLGLSMFLPENWSSFLGSFIPFWVYLLVPVVTAIIGYQVVYREMTRD